MGNCCEVGELGRTGTMSASSSATDPESPTDKPSTLVGRLHALAESNPGGTAFFHKERGVWQRTTWRGLSDEVQRVSAGLHGLGFQPGDMTVLVTDPSPPWVVMILAVEALGGTAFAVHEPFSASDLLQSRGETRPRFLLASRPEHVTRLRTLPGAPVIEHRMVVDGRALQLDDPGVLTYESLNGPAPAPAVTASTAPLMLSYTGGATGAPKAWALTSGKLLDVGSALLDHIRRLGCDLGRRDRMVADMPTGEIGALVVHVVLPLLCGAVPHCADAPDAADVAIRVVRPTFAVRGRHHWERWVSQVAVDIDSGSRLKRLVFRAAQ